MCWVTVGYLVAASYCPVTLAGMRPRSLTGMLLAFAHARMSPLRSRAAEVRAFPECLCVFLAEIDLVFRAVYREPQRLVGGTPIEIIF